MNIFNIISVLMVIFISGQCLEACTGELDYLTFGVVLNDSECMQFSNLYKLGVENVNYYRSCLQIKPSPGTKDILVLSPLIEPPLYGDPVTIKSVDITSELLTLNVEYGGGCATHQFNMYVMPQIDSLSRTHDFYLLNDAGSDNCKALINETISFNLYPFINSLDTEFPRLFRFFAYVSSDGPQAQDYVEYTWSPEQNCSVTYRGHGGAGDYIMVTLEKNRTTGNRTEAPRVLISLDPNIETEMPVNFAPIMDNELDWLQKMNIITGIDSTDRKAIKQDLKNGGNQYYTLQDTFLPLNMWFTGEKDSTGKWITNGIKGCCIDFSYNLPPSRLDLTGTNKNAVFSASRNRKITASISCTGLLKINSERNLSGSALKIVSITGRILFSGILNNRNAVAIPKALTMSNGWKAVSVSLGKSTVVCPLVSQY